MLNFDDITKTEGDVPLSPSCIGASTAATAGSPPTATTTVALETIFPATAADGEGFNGNWLTATDRSNSSNVVLVPNESCDYERLQEKTKRISWIFYAVFLVSLAVGVPCLWAALELKSNASPPGASFNNSSSSSSSSNRSSNGNYSAALAKNSSRADAIAVAWAVAIPGAMFSFIGGELLLMFLGMLLARSMRRSKEIVVDSAAGSMKGGGAGSDSEIQLADMRYIEICKKEYANDGFGSNRNRNRNNTMQYHFERNRLSTVSLRYFSRPAAGSRMRDAPSSEFDKDVLSQAPQNAQLYSKVLEYAPSGEIDALAEKWDLLLRSAGASQLSQIKRDAGAPVFDVAGLSGKTCEQNRDEIVYKTAFGSGNAANGPVHRILTYTVAPVVLVFIGMAFAQAIVFSGQSQVSPPEIVLTVTDVARYIMFAILSVLLCVIFPTTFSALQVELTVHNYDWGRPPADRTVTPIRIGYSAKYMMFGCNCLNFETDTSMNLRASLTIERNVPHPGTCRCTSALVQKDSLVMLTIEDQQQQEHTVALEALNVWHDESEGDSLCEQRALKRWVAVLRKIGVSRVDVDGVLFDKRQQEVGQQDQQQQQQRAGAAGAAIGVPVTPLAEFC